ncbi:MAG: ferrochelatase [Burkholderiales bacterium]|nr:ferrochelatase [Burkholderiales bacterium]
MFAPEPPYRHGDLARVGVLLVNLGTPDAPDAPALRRYLRQFLWDPRVVEIPRPIWWAILHGVILRVRPKKSAAKYATVWTPEGSPLRVHTERQADGLARQLSARFASPTTVRHAMRYGQPSIADGLAALRADGCDRILVVPLYPQYAASTTGSTYDAVFDAIKGMRHVPELRLVKHFHDHPGYIAALARQVRAYWTEHGRTQKLVMSFHGVPRFHLDRGDPYHCECRKTGRLLGEALGLAPNEWMLTFQSRFGRAKWLEPYTQETLERLPEQGVKAVDVVCPGFVSDCLETLEEIGEENREAFLEAGGERFRYIPCLNESDAWLQALADIAAAHLHGWVDPAWDAAQAAHEGAQQRQRAMALGASA